jgi:hypothetical protein
MVAMSRSIKRSRSCDVGHIFSDGEFEDVFWQAIRRTSSADRRGWSSEIQETAYRKGQRLVVAFRKKRAGAHSGGNLRVRAFFISSFLSQE